MLLLLAGCNTPQPEKVIYTGSPSTDEQSTMVEEENPLEVSDPYVRARIFADMLYEARLDFENNRLMSPAGNNAYERYREVLGYDPENAVALQGLEDIVLRYIELADAALRQQKIDEAESLLSRAAQIDPAREELTAARLRISQANRFNTERFDLDPAQLNMQSLVVMTELATIAEQILRNDATFLIYARNDAEGRWIYKIMREAVGGQRLRGNIDISSTPGVVINRTQIP